MGGGGRLATAAWPTNTLVESLGRAGWGDLGGREWQGLRSTLRALVDALPYGSGAGLATAAQVADGAGLSERWVRTRLQLLEDADLIAWQRGGVMNGAPLPSHFRVNKRRLAELVNAARQILTRVREARQAVTNARIAGIRYLKSPKRKQTRRSVHAELAASPGFRREETARPSGAAPSHPATNRPAHKVLVTRDHTEAWCTCGWEYLSDYQPAVDEAAERHRELNDEESSP